VQYPIPFIIAHPYSNITNGIKKKTSTCSVRMIPFAKDDASSYKADSHD